MKTQMTFGQDENTNDNKATVIRVLGSRLQSSEMLYKVGS